MQGKEVVSEKIKNDFAINLLYILKKNLSYKLKTSIDHPSSFSFLVRERGGLSDSSISCSNSPVSPNLAPSYLCIIILTLLHIKNWAPHQFLFSWCPAHSHLNISTRAVMNCQIHDVIDAVKGNKLNWYTQCPPNIQRHSNKFIEQCNAVFAVLGGDVSHYWDFCKANRVN